jgi:SWI/SNF-related matrix-associated actin-dependent regulator of chromatin subfamily A-like protein 1
MTTTASGSEARTAAHADRIADRLFPHQVEGVAFLLKRRRAILADDMGLGKTRQAIIGLHVGEPGGPYLIVCPASVKRNWQREIEMALPGARSQVIGGRSDAVAPDADWVIVNYDILGAHAERLRTIAWRGMVFDEAHYLKNHQSQRSRHARSIVHAADDPLVYALTGTPLTNRPRDLFPLLQLCGHALARSFLSFAKRYCAAYQTDYGWVTDGASNLDELAVQLHGLMLRRTKDDVLDLPPKLRTWLPVDVPAATGAKEMGDVVRLLLDTQIGGRSAHRGGDAADRGRLLASLTRARQKLAAAKAADTIDFVENAVGQGEKVIVFSCFDEPLRRIQTHFGDAAVLLTGATPAARRQKLVDTFQADDGVRVFAANIIAGGVGINLTAARQVVFNDLDWVPANHWQAEDRAYRIGQTNAVNVTYMTATGTVDDFVSTLLEAKTRLVDAVVGRKALDAAVADGSVLDELQRLLHALSPRIADLRVQDLDADEVARLLRDAAFAAAHEARDAAGVSHDPVGTDHGEAMRQALSLLEQALAPPQVTKYRVSSSTRPGQYYLLEVDAAGDVSCGCPGFEYRGQCSHGRALKAALARGGSLPSGCEALPDCGQSPGGMRPVAGGEAAFAAAD